MAMVGAKLRQARQDRDLSLQAVAEQADISAATLSRIENGKQGLELGLFLRLAGILERNPGDLVDNSETPEDGVDPLVRKLAALSSPDRKILWQRLAESRRQRAATSSRRRQQTAEEVEELLAQLEMLRSEIQSFRERLG